MRTWLERLFCDAYDWPICLALLPLVPFILPALLIAHGPLALADRWQAARDRRAIKAGYGI